jgi:hypothetical protein
MLVALSALAITGCVSKGEASIMSDSKVDQIPEEQFVWVGTGTSWRYDADEWVRTPDQDYEFLVRQNRFADRWESLKVQNRTSADYDGTAGAADQQHFFRIEYGEQNTEGTVPVTVSSTYGDGLGTSGPDYEWALLEINADVRRLAPYNTIRIEQNYNYREGVLTETVLLLEVSEDGEEQPFVRIDERARIFRPAES